MIFSPIRLKKFPVNLRQEQSQTDVRSMAFTEKQKRKLNELIEPFLADRNIELIETKLKRTGQNKTLEIVIDKEGGITVEECAQTSRKISLILDVEELFAFSYGLEVGSPGIFRVLKKESDFIRFLNSRVKAVYHTTGKEMKRCVGILTQYRNRQLTIRDGNRNTTVDLDRIEKVHLYPEL